MKISIALMITARMIQRCVRVVAVGDGQGQSRERHDRAAEDLEPEIELVAQAEDHAALHRVRLGDRERA
jgi:hypothetical protein